MLRFFIPLFFFFSCSHHIVNKGGERAFLYDPDQQYSSEELKLLAPEIIMTSQRNPPELTLRDYLKNSLPLKKIGVIVFETEIQPTRSGLAGEDKIYLSESGKQLMTEKFLTIWEETLSSLMDSSTFYPAKKIASFSKASEFGSTVPDYLLSERDIFDKSDVFLKNKGDKTTLTTVLSPRGFRDLSFLLVPASELMGGPKWSEHQKHFVNEVSKELGLDAVLVIYSQVSWTSNRVDKHSGESFGEDLKINLSASLLGPLSKYRKKAIERGVSDPSSVSICLASYSTSLKRPIDLSFSKRKVLDQVQQQLINPLFKNYRDLVFMMVQKISDDFKADL